MPTHAVYNVAVCTFVQVCEGHVRLSLSTRKVGELTIVRCSGRIVAGEEVEALRKHIADLMLDRNAFILHMGEVAFIDSSGVGTLVRLLTSTRRAGGDLKLCNLPRDVHNVLKVTNLITMFDAHESEESAVTAFYRRQAAPMQATSAGPTVLCVDHSADVLAYLRELLRSAGYNVLTNSNLPDALILLRATRPGVIVLGPSLKSSPGTQQAFRDSSSTAHVVELGDQFSTSHAGQAASELLEKIRISLHPQTGMASTN